MTESSVRTISVRTFNSDGTLVEISKIDQPDSRNRLEELSAAVDALIIEALEATDG